MTLKGFAVLLAISLLALLAAMACGDDGDGDQTPQADETPEAAETPEADGGDGGDDGDGADGDDGDGDGGDAFGDVPLPDGADETSSLTISGSSLPFVVPPGTDVDAEAFGDVTMKTYEVSGSAGDVIDFYKDRRGDWDEVFAASADEGGLLIWTRDDGERVVWISVGEGIDAGNTSLVIILGQVSN
jgi:hypothetical protein